MAAIRKAIDIQGDNVMEHAIAELMEDGAIRKHARKAYGIYKERRENMEQMLVKYLGEHVYITKPEGGLAYWIKFKKQINTKKLAEQLLQKGVLVIPAESFSFSGSSLNALRLGYASLTREELEVGLKIIGSVLAKH
jgi:GntR family transcriptional regulator/MocR family aminotransferase